MPLSTDTPPPSLRSIGHFVKIANEYAARDVVIYYWCLYRAVQDGMKLDKSSPDALNYLTSLLSVLEQIKKENPNVDALTQDVVAQAHIEDRAQKMFSYAESQDKTEIFNSKVVKAFYTSSYLFDLLSVFGPMEENVQNILKYAKWRATYIHNCLKNGEKPVSGSQSAANNDPAMDELGEDFSNVLRGFPAPPTNAPSNENSFAAPHSSNSPQQPNWGGQAPSYPSIGGPQYPAQKPGAPVPQPRQPINPADFSFVPPPPQQQQQQPASGYQQVPAASVPMHSTSTNVSMDDYIEAKKFVKYALSALDYDDAKTSIENMRKALAILEK